MRPPPANQKWPKQLQLPDNPLCRDHLQRQVPTASSRSTTAKRVRASEQKKAAPRRPANKRKILSSGNNLTDIHTSGAFIRAWSFVCERLCPAHAHHSDGPYFAAPTAHRHLQHT